MTSLPDYKPTFPNWKSNTLAQCVKQLDSSGLDLLQKTLTYDPATRISAKAALQHPYFVDLDKASLPASNQ